MAKRRTRNQTASTKTLSNEATQTKKPKENNRRSSLSASTKTRQARTRRAFQLYEKAIAALQQHSFRKARNAFQQILTDYPEEQELGERASLYLKLCDREAQEHQAPQTIEEKLLAATVALNAHSVDEAITEINAAAEMDPDNDKVHYLLALACSLQGNNESAVNHLSRAIALNDENRILAKDEPDFESMSEDPLFQKVIEPPPAPDH